MIKEISKIAHATSSTGCCCVWQLHWALQISNYAKPGHRSRHNQVYWHCQPYYAFGLGAASYARGRRFTRPRVMREYEEWVQGFVASGAGCPAADLPPESKVRTYVCA
jgi:coproporphyrinogen III oxidase-like Fe-S oxidoreductase